MAGSGETSALTMGVWGADLAAATAFTGWSTAVHPALREQQPRAPETRCVTVATPPPPATRDAALVARPAPPAAVARPAVVPRLTADPAPPAMDHDARGRPRRRHHRRSEGGSERAPSVWLERDPVSTAPAGP
ncbi:MAG: hypothetical protein U0325_03915 [Polyangiales bacterium]